VVATYTAEIVEVAASGMRLRPVAGSTVPTEPNEVNLLGLAIALAMGAAGYEHHPEPRDPEIQTIGGLLTGDATMPWRVRRPRGTEAGALYVVCDNSDSATWRCRIEQSADGTHPDSAEHH
jgi:hypothetical protein